MVSTAIRRDRTDGIPGSGAAARVAANGGPIAERKSKIATAGPTALLLRNQGSGDSTSRPDADVQEEDDETFDDGDAAGESGEAAGASPSVLPSYLRERRPLPTTSTGSSGIRRRASDGLPPARRPAPHTEPLRGHGRLHWLLPASLGAISLIVVYTLAFLVAVGVTDIYNVMHYGPVPTSTVDTVIGGQLAHILATNVHGTIYVTIFEEQGAGKMSIAAYQGPQLAASDWGGDLDGIVPLLSVRPSSSGGTPTIIIQLIGSYSYTSFFSRPVTTFELVPGGTGYHVVSL